MRLLHLGWAVLLMLPAAALAQEPGDTDILSAYLRRAYSAFSKDFRAVVETMPEEDFGFRPSGAVDEVRNFGQIVRHIVEVNSFVCAMGDGMPDERLEAGISGSKAGLLIAMDRTDARCTAYLATLTDDVLTQRIRTGPSDRQLEAVRGNAAIFAIAHSNEHYGNLVTYLRARGLVPPRTAAQASFLTQVRQP